MDDGISLATLKVKQRNNVDTTAKINFVDIVATGLETFVLNRKTILKTLLSVILIVPNLIYALDADEDVSFDYKSVGVSCLMQKIDNEMNKLWEQEKAANFTNSSNLEDIQKKLIALRKKHSEFHVLRQQKTAEGEESGSMFAMKTLFPEYSECLPKEYSE